MPDETIATRASLLGRLKDLGDVASWEEFYQTYRELIYSVARKAGLNETEAEEAVQETLISVAKKMPGFKYDPTVDSFKGWLRPGRDLGPGMGKASFAGRIGENQTPGASAALRDLSPARHSRPARARSRPFG